MIGIVILQRNWDIASGKSSCLWGFQTHFLLFQKIYFCYFPWKWKEGRECASLTAMMHLFLKSFESHIRPSPIQVLECRSLTENWKILSSIRASKKIIQKQHFLFCFLCPVTFITTVFNFCCLNVLHGNVNITTHIKESPGNATLKFLLLSLLPLSQCSQLNVSFLLNKNCNHSLAVVCLHTPVKLQFSSCLSRLI